MGKGLKGYEKRDRHLRALGFSSYQEYLRSPLWKELRRVAIDRAGGLCEVCGKRGRDVHHRSYARSALSGDTNSLVFLCRDCHKAAEYTETGRKVNHMTANRRLSKMAAANGRSLLSSCTVEGCNYIRSPAKSLCGYCDKE